MLLNTLFNKTGRLPLSISILSKGPNWFKPIKIAAAEVNPLMIGLDKSWVINPTFIKPSKACIIPTMSDKIIANSMYSFDPIEANKTKPLPMSRESIAVGPTES